MQRIKNLPKPAIIAGLIILVILAAYIGRGWLRQSAVPFYASRAYMPGLHKQFDDDFRGTDLTLTGFGYHFAHNDEDGCLDPEFSGFGESVYCDVHATSNKARPSAEATKIWQASSKIIEKQLLEVGWTKDNPDQPIAALLNYTDLNDTSQWSVTYRKHHGPSDCSLSIINSPSSRESFVEKGCGRSVNIFGGY
jgi:hypothetical protein